MNFLSPAAFGLLLLLPLIVAMYLLRLQRTEHKVSSTYLWRRMVRDVEANAPWQKLRRNLLLLLQLLFLALLIFALTRPFSWTDKPAGRTAVLVVDLSASMGAVDMGSGNAPTTRLHAAKVQMRQWIDSLPTEAAITLITAGQRPQIVAASTQDRRQIYAVLDALQPTLQGSDLAAALELAVAVAAHRPDAVIGLFSDFAAAEGLISTAGGAPVQFFPLGTSDNNQAITALSLNEAPDGSGQTLFAQVTNYGRRPVQRRLTLSVGTNEAQANPGQPYAAQLYTVFDLTLESAGESASEQAVVVDDLPADVTFVQAHLEGVADVLPLDDTAWAVANARHATITLVTNGNRFLETALALLPNLTVTTIRPADFENGQDDSHSDGMDQASQLTILDGYVPITATLPVGNLLFLAPPASTPLFTMTGTLEQPVTRLVDTNHALLRYVNLADVNVLEAAQLVLPNWAQPLIVDDTAPEAALSAKPPLLFIGQPNGQRVAVLAFDLRNSDLPLQVSFPLLLVNLTDWLTTGGVGSLPTILQPDTPLSIALPPAVQEATLTRPDGSTAQLLPGERHAIRLVAEQTGLYTLQWDGAVRARAALNLYAPQESNVQPGPAPTSATGTSAEESNELTPAQREWWRPLALAALALLMAEWLVYHRGAVARLLQEARRLWGTWKPIRQT